MNDDRDFGSRLKRLGDEFEPDTERGFEVVVRTADRRKRTRRAGAAIGETAAIVLIAVLVFRGGIPSSGAAPSPSLVTQLAGTWVTTLSSSAPPVALHGLNGTWVLAYGASGVLGVTSPPTYIGPSQGYTYQVTGDTFRTDFLGADVCSGLAPGTYGYQQTARILVLRAVDDACAGRIALLTTSPWTPATE